MSAAFRGQREEVEQMKSCLRVLSQPAPPTAGEAELATDQQEREGALELLADLCENMDNAAGTPSPQQSIPHAVWLSPRPFSPGSPPAPPSPSLLLPQEQGPSCTPPSHCGGRFVLRLGICPLI